MDLLPITLRVTLNLPKPIRPKPAIKPEQFRPIPRRVRTSELVWIGLDWSGFNSMDEAPGARQS